MAISKSEKKKHFINEVICMTKRCELKNALADTTCYKYDKETQMWHGYITNCRNEIIQDFGYNEKFEELEKQVKIMKGEG